MKKLTLSLVVLAVFAVVLRADNIVDEIIARVNDSIITQADYKKAQNQSMEELKQQFPSDWQTRWSQQQKDLLRELIDRQILLERGKEMGVTGETEVVKRLNTMRQQMNLPDMDSLEREARKQGVSFEDLKEDIRTRVVTEQVIGQEVGSHLHITNEDIKDFYDKHQKDLQGEEEVSLSEILVATQVTKPEGGEKKDAQGKAQPDKPLPEDPALVAQAEAKANQILQSLRGGAKFEDLAKQYSNGATAAQGGPLGNFKRGELAKDFEDKTFSLKPDEFTDLIRTKQGFLIMKVNNHRSAGVPPLKEIEDRIRQAIYSQKLEPAARAYLTKLREKYYIDVKTGYVDTGATANPNRPIMVAAAGDPATRQGKSGLKKKKKFLLF
jgi:peptidyl-prolyl cis-trans isomerase SurA